MARFVSENLMLRSVLAASLLLLPSAASGYETLWHEVLPDVRVRLIVGKVHASPEKTLAGLQVDMPPSYRSYWRIPGEAGIAPQIDWSASKGVENAALLFPLPKVENVGGYTDNVYHGSVVFPIELDLTGEGATLDASLFMGICSDICIPVTALLNLSLNEGEGSGTHVMELAQALAAVPAQWEFSDPAIASVTYQDEGNGLLVRSGYSGVELTSIVASVDDGSVFFGPALEVAEPGAAFIPLLGGATVDDIPGGTVTLSFASDMGPYEVSAAVTQ